ncbi:dTDP-4-dehydrorhamnose 3,5-epimerase [Rhizobium laguerreae]|uniref:dTDP-4-dehydrorhamnose 3,5-epimerase n=1 Tax=Rhizobium laguerreae TaxID=1076926 RepID=A0ABR6G8P5_9HYPH|nr:dTDP-4-dehydrorhamnose 3,5-epimerase [Rhizobium laguerreae]MBB3162636.1 dTDP-4-dehydrorhamnose 3,5-epimerase [Rhizobium laguerreae]MBY3275653.1 dTDP-4-dehydrorhamnose 3,5-epimerase [Rhizobium laguerreae]NKM15471.1 dTDP-4-dehydrorhamnose 3,5-epimerase [Rhizobium laguerreae]NKM19269.1 dTDP-4-dehydrorhamnose 3,5-epimerase [Rhizobium laguerreae]NKM42231.1 dTDP-4-dehydrorhamnose 3,5-epimerase [Rhizobium laguerreae]
MKFVPTAVSGAFVVEVEARSDERGLFARTFDAKSFADHGLVPSYPQCNVSQNHKRGTLRGMHFQAEPRPEIKLVRATRGTVFDVALDLRRDSPSYLKWASVELDAISHNAFYIPAGCAHGFLTLDDDCELFYQMSEAYVPELARGVRWDDPAFSIAWPFPPSVISERDAALESYSQETNL